VYLNNRKEFLKNFVRSEIMRKRNTLLSSSGSNNSSGVEAVDIYYSDSADEVGISEGEPDFKNSVATFSFFGNEPSITKEKPKTPTVEEKKPVSTSAPSENIPKAVQKGSTPPIDGEHFTLKRCYQFRPSTVRKLNEIKSRHADINVYLNTVLDEAIQHYYGFLFDRQDT
jgi:hypothetical protein